jgi:hypothetical protein
MIPLPKAAILCQERHTLSDRYITPYKDIFHPSDLDIIIGSCTANFNFIKNTSVRGKNENGGRLKLSADGECFFYRVGLETFMMNRHFKSQAYDVMASLYKGKWIGLDSLQR